MYIINCSPCQWWASKKISTFYPEILACVEHTERSSSYSTPVIIEKLYYHARIFKCKYPLLYNKIALAFGYSHMPGIPGFCVAFTIYSFQSTSSAKLLANFYYKTDSHSAISVF